MYRECAESQNLYKNKIFWKKFKKSVDEKNKKPKIHIVRWTERNEKSSLKTNLDNLCGHSLNSWAEIKEWFLKEAECQI